MEWSLCFAPNRQCKGKDLLTVAEVKASGYPVISATVPGNFELDLTAAGLEKDLFYSTDVFRAQQWEATHVWYFTTFDAAPEQYLHFGGIDTVANIILNGSVVRRVENMFVAVDLDAPLREKDNELIVHIYPAVLAARERRLPVCCMGMEYNIESLYLRKAPHMYGWDIMPRIVSAGLWQPVELRTRKKDAVEEVFFYCRSVRPIPEAGTTAPEYADATAALYAALTLDEDFTDSYRYRLTLTDGEQTFAFEDRLRSNYVMTQVELPHCRLWWPKPVGRPHLYHLTLQLFKDGTLCDSYELDTGIRSVQLDRTDSMSHDGADGRFVFLVNDKKIFITGTNWVPLDAFHSRDEVRLPAAAALLDDIGCNMIRCWGGNVYGSDSLYDFCDRHGILVWQDFAMACAAYPQEEAFYAMLREEVSFTAKRLRNHPSLALWAGDNECDETYTFWNRSLRDPAHYPVTRRVIPEVLEAHDFTRPYLPSSPYVSSEAMQPGRETPENHLWGPRDYFKGPFYNSGNTIFASETGYHGCPSPASLARFIRPEALWPMTKENGEPNDDYLAHAACMEPDPERAYAYRIPLMISQVNTLFGETWQDLDTFARMSQISQAEAKKFFIERFRQAKWRRTGIIWWNLIDGWPQVSDAVTDYYGCKKLAYSFIRRSQNPVCLMLSEPDADGRYTLMGVNDLPTAVGIAYTVQDVTAGRQIGQGETLLQPDSAAPLLTLSVPEHRMLLFRWQPTEKSVRTAPDGRPVAGSNHFYTALREVDYAAYLRDLRACGYDAFEGFEAGNG